MAYMLTLICDTKWLATHTGEFLHKLSYTNLAGTSE